MVGGLVRERYPVGGFKHESLALLEFWLFGISAFRGAKTRVGAWIHIDRGIL